MMATTPRYTDTQREDSSSMELGRTRSQAPTTMPVTGITPIPQHRTDLGHHHERNPPNAHHHQNANEMTHLHLIQTTLPTMIRVHQTPTRADGGDLTTTTGLPPMTLSNLTGSWKKQNLCSPTLRLIPDTKDLREFSSSPWLMLTCTRITKHAIA